jgi:hypothetical protein
LPAARPALAAGLLRSRQIDKEALMARKHAVLISLAVASALVAGVFAAVRTTELGASASAGTTLSAADLSSRDRELDRMSKHLRAHARKRPPKLPALVVPASAGGSVPSGHGPGPQLVSNSGPGSASSGPGGFDDDGEDFDDHDEHFDDHDEDDDDSSGHGGDDDDHGEDHD